MLFLLCLHSLEVSCSQRQVLVARDLWLHYQKPEPSQRHGQPPSLTGFWPLTKEGTEAFSPEKKNGNFPNTKRLWGRDICGISRLSNFGWLIQTYNPVQCDFLVSPKVQLRLTLHHSPADCKVICNRPGERGYRNECQCMNACLFHTQCWRLRIVL